jgi:hypothetical protein
MKKEFAAGAERERRLIQFMIWKRAVESHPAERNEIRNKRERRGKALPSTLTTSKDSWKNESWMRDMRQLFLLLLLLVVVVRELKKKKKSLIVAGWWGGIMWRDRIKPWLTSFCLCSRHHHHHVLSTAYTILVSLHCTSLLHVAREEEEAGRRRWQLVDDDGL